MVNLTLFQLISHIESQANLYALRFEPTVYAKRSYFSDEIARNIVIRNHCTPDTALVISSTSWGMIQIMGFNLYAGDAFRKSVGEFLESLPEQKQFFERFVNERHINYSVPDLHYDNKRKKFALDYNGSVLYVDKINKALTFFGV